MTSRLRSGQAEESPEIRIASLQKQYGAVEVLRGIDLTVERGEFVCLLGLSGAGKTTLIRCINGLVTPTAGDVFVGGTPLPKHGPELRRFRRRIGMVFQHFNLVGRLSAIQNVLTGISGKLSTARSVLGIYSAKDRSFALECLRRTGIERKADARSDTLSGGEKQRVAVARVLAQAPNVILADEPVSSVDLKIGRQILGLLQKIAKEDQITVVCNIHNVDMAKAFADRIIGMSNGVIVFDGRPSELDESALDRIYQSNVEALALDDADSASQASSTASIEPQKTAWVPSDRQRDKVTYLAWGGAAVAILVWSAIGAEVNPLTLVAGTPQMLDFFSRMFPPDLERLPRLVTPVLETLHIAIWGTFLAVVLAVPLGLLAARNITPWPFAYWLSRLILNTCRGVSELVFALIFVAAVGLGPFPGVLALTLHNLGMLGKFYGDSIENVDPGPIDALYSTGATRLQTIRWAIFPQIFPDFISFNLYRFEVSVRAASILGVVGAGGIGFPLITSMRLFRYQETTTILILIVLMVVITDYIASALRRRVI